MEKEIKEKNKQLKLKNKGWNMELIAFNVPTKDVSCTFKITNFMSADTARRKVKRFEDIIDTWWEDSIVCYPKHFIRDVSVPGTTAIYERNITVSVDINILSRIEVERGWNSFPKNLVEELEILGNSLYHEITCKF